MVSHFYTVTEMKKKLNEPDVQKISYKQLQEQDVSWLQ